jgi:hypothetical protein
MKIKHNAARAKAAKACVAAYGAMTARVCEWYVIAGRDGLTALPFNALWKVFMKDAEITSKSESYGSLWMTLNRMVNGVPTEAAATTAPDHSDPEARAVAVMALAGHLLDAGTVKLVARIVTGQ